MGDDDDFMRHLTGQTFAFPQDYRRSGWSQHVPFAFWLVEQLQPRCLVELGVFHGMSFLAFCQAVAASGAPTKTYAVDTWLGDAHAHRIEAGVFEDLSALTAGKYGGFATLVRSTFDAARDRFADGSVDLLHIDGFHTYEAVSGDFHAWRPKLSPDAIVLFHDTHEDRDDFGVHRFWGEVRGLGRSFDFEHGHGLGVLALGTGYSPGLEALLQAPAEETALIRSIFSRLGAGISDRQKLVVAQKRLALLTGNPAYRAAHLIVRKARSLARRVQDA